MPVRHINTYHSRQQHLTDGFEKSHGSSKPTAAGPSACGAQYTWDLNNVMEWNRGVNLIFVTIVANSIFLILTLVAVAVWQGRGAQLAQWGVL